MRHNNNTPWALADCQSGFVSELQSVMLVPYELSVYTLIVHTVAVSTCLNDIPVYTLRHYSFFLRIFPMFYTSMNPHLYNCFFIINKKKFINIAME